MKKIINNLKFEEIKYSCGYGAINNVFKNYGYLLAVIAFSLFFYCS